MTATTAAGTSPPKLDLDGLLGALSLTLREIKERVRLAEHTLQIVEETRETSSEALRAPSSEPSSLA